jgi:hypothetical protein
VIGWGLVVLMLVGGVALVMPPRNQPPLDPVDRLNQLEEDDRRRRFRRWRPIDDVLLGMWMIGGAVVIAAHLLSSA